MLVDWQSHTVKTLIRLLLRSSLIWAFTVCLDNSVSIFWFDMAPIKLMIPLQRKNKQCYREKWLKLYLRTTGQDSDKTSKNAVSLRTSLLAPSSTMSSISFYSFCAQLPQKARMRMQNFCYTGMLASWLFFSNPKPHCVDSRHILYHAIEMVYTC